MSKSFVSPQTASAKRFDTAVGPVMVSCERNLEGKEMIYRYYYHIEDEKVLMSVNNLVLAITVLLTVHPRIGLKKAVEMMRYVKKGCISEDIE